MQLSAEDELLRGTLFSAWRWCPFCAHCDQGAEAEVTVLVHGHQDIKTRRNTSALKTVLLFDKPKNVGLNTPLKHLCTNACHARQLSLWSFVCFFLTINLHSKGKKWSVWVLPLSPGAWSKSISNPDRNLLFANSTQPQLTKTCQQDFSTT